MKYAYWVTYAISLTPFKQRLGAARVMLTVDESQIDTKHVEVMASNIAVSEPTSASLPIIVNWKRLPGDDVSERS